MKKLFPLLFLAATITASAQPRIEVEDLDFGVLGVGISQTRELRICNTGTGTLMFSKGPWDGFIEWSRKAEYSIAPGELERLRTTTLAPDECITVPVTFVSNTELDYRDSAHVFSNATGRKSWSIWTAQVRQPGPRLAGYDWGRQWVVTPLNLCTKNTLTEYPAEINVSNEGTGTAIVTSLTIVGPDASSFQLDMTDPATTVRPGDQLIKGADPKRQRVIFTPAEERNYSAQLILLARDPLNGMVDTLYADLAGIGIESHISISDVHYGQVAVGASRTRTVSIRAFPTRRTTITNIALAGMGAASFRFGSAASLPVAANPWILEPGTTRDIEIVAEPRAGGALSALLVVTGDFSRCDDSVAVLSVNASSGVDDGEIVSGNAIVRVESGMTTLRLARPGSVTLEIFNSAGERAMYAIRELAAGDAAIAFDRLRAGAYHLRVSSGGWSAVRGFVVQ